MFGVEWVAARRIKSLPMHGKRTMYAFSFSLDKNATLTSEVETMFQILVVVL